jgi:hypothetical protein
LEINVAAVQYCEITGRPCWISAGSLFPQENDGLFAFSRRRPDSQPSSLRHRDLRPGKIVLIPGQLVDTVWKHSAGGHGVRHDLRVYERGVAAVVWEQLHHILALQGYGRQEQNDGGKFKFGSSRESMHNKRRVSY